MSTLVEVGTLSVGDRFSINTPEPLHSVYIVVSSCDEGVSASFPHDPTTRYAFDTTDKVTPSDSL